MLKKQYLFLAIAVTSLCLGLLSSPPVLAQVDNPCPDGTVRTSFDFGSGADGCTSVGTTVNDNPITTALLVVLNFLGVGVGIAVVAGIIWGAILYTTSNGNASKSQQGISVIVNAIVGLLLFVFLYAIANYLVPGGLFT